MMWNDDRYRMHEQGGFGWLMLVLMLVVAIAVVVAVVALLRGGALTIAAPRAAAAGSPDARAILQERFARGEIDESDFRSRIRALDEART